MKGFGIRLRAGGKRTWIIQYRIGKLQKRKTLGAFPTVKTAEAREKARKDLAKVALGGDPQGEKLEERARAAQTFKAVVEKYLAYQERRLRPRSYQPVKAHLEKHWFKLSNFPIRKIDRKAIADCLDEIVETRGPIAANRARTTLSGFFSWAIGRGWADANPVIATPRPAEESARDRVLMDPELAAVWRACGDDDHGRIVRLLILTGARRDEVGNLARSEIDLTARRWLLPAARAKNNREHEIPLSDLAVSILELALAREGRENRAAIFGDGPRHNGGSVRGFSGWSKAKAALDRRIEPPLLPWRLHDLRRSVATGMAELGVKPHVIEATLNHVSGHKAGVAGIYNHAAYAPEKRQALDRWAAHVEVIVAGKAGSNVVPMRA